MTMKRFKIITVLLLSVLFFSCNNNKTNNSNIIEAGVSKKLNDARFSNISKVVYKLHFVVSAKKSKPLVGELEMAFDIKDIKKNVILDFRKTKSAFHKLYINGKVFKKFKLQNGHIIIPGKMLKKGRNILGMEFTPDDLSFKRNANYIYTMFYPNHASAAFPCFDQPDLKGQFILALDVPLNWVAVSNGPQVSVKIVKDKKRYVFGQTKPINTYLFSFAAGIFTKIKKTIEGHALTIYYNEKDKKKIKNNLDDIMLLQADAITWMEQYTGMVYPFQKFDFVLLPSLKYNGIENPGNVFYNSGKMFLDKKATLTQKLFRARLIANQTARIWLGDLVTMKWFNEVWFKDSFATFMADKMANPSFPTFNHDLRFLVNFYPKSYAIDRTNGTHPIEQPLENLNMACSFSDSLIQYKTPILMRKLEEILGYEKFRQGIIKYLRKYAYANAGWDDLITILNKKTDKDLLKWSNVWVKKASMPIYKLTHIHDELFIDQFDMQNKLHFWPQNLYLLYVKDGKYRERELYDDKQQYLFPLQDIPDFLFLNDKGKAYGYQVLDDRNRTFLMGINVFRMPALSRGAVYINLWEDMQNYNTWPEDLRSIFPYYIKMETEVPNINLLLNYYQKLFWRFSLPNDRDSIARKMEPILWKKINQANTVSLKLKYFKTLEKTAILPSSIKKLVAIWQKRYKIKGLQLTDNDFIELAYELAVRKETPVANIIPDDILKIQLNRISKPDIRKEMIFIIPALNKNQNVRTEFFESLKLPANRQHEQWVLKAVHYLNHPLVAMYSEPFILPALKMLPEIAETSSIYFPKKWLTELFYGHNSLHAAKLIHEYLSKNHNSDVNFKLIILQAADPVFRSSKILHPDN